MAVAISVARSVTDCGYFCMLIATLTGNGMGPLIVIARKVQVKARRRLCMTRTAVG
jgi:predicted solute-binding protein